MQHLWSHGRRKFYELADIAAAKRRAKDAAPISPLALEAVKRIDALFDIEREINGESAERRVAVRRERSAPLVAEFETWMRTERARRRYARVNLLIFGVNQKMGRRVTGNTTAVHPGA